MDQISLCAVVGWTSLHVGAIATAWGTRLAADSRFEAAAQAACYLALGLVGGAAAICRMLDLSLWILSGVTLVAMVLTAVVDFRRTGEFHSPLSAVASS